jgi:predicted cupin superfamily sugar epimerase
MSEFMTADAAYWIRKLELIKHPEGGYYRESYRAGLTIPAAALPPEYKGGRAASTAIYFLLDGESVSALHRLRSDELWHFYLGGTLLVQVIESSGACLEIRLGNDLAAGETLQAVVKAGSWFGAKLLDQTSFALVGCTVAPGFDFPDFELAKRSELLQQYPQHRRVIEELARR